MKKFIITEEEKSRILNLHEGFKKGVISEQFTKVEGPYKDAAAQGGTGDLYIMKLEKSMCRWDQGTKHPLFGDNESMYLGYMTPMTAATCGDGFTTIPGGKFYVQGTVDGKIKMYNKDSRYYDTATNMGQGYNTTEEAKAAIKVLVNPKGLSGRQVDKGTDGVGTKWKEVTKYDKDGTLKKDKFKMVTSGGTKTVERSKSGL